MPVKREIKFIVVHCSDSDVIRHDSVEVIRKWHLARGFDDIGYHYIITKDGVIHRGRDIEQVGAHVKGYNKDSIGICLTGRRKFSKEQFASLRNLCQDLCAAFKLERFDVLHHRDLDDNKTCPNFDLFDVLTWRKDGEERNH